MEFIAIICIPINCGILYFTGTTKDQDSSFARTLKKQNEEFWTAENIIILCVLLEHAVILIKVLMQLFIDDVPLSVKIQERKRPIIEKNAQAFIRKFRESNKVPFKKTFEDILYGPNQQEQAQNRNAFTHTIKPQIVIDNDERSAFIELVKLIEADNEAIHTKRLNMKNN